MTGVDAYILIGGRSTRLGRDKATVDLGGQTLGQRAFQTVSEALPDSRVTFVAANEAQFAIEAIIAEGRFIFDLVPNLGPISGFHAALADTAKPWIFLLACDYPFVSPQLITYLSENISVDCGAAVPEQSDGRRQPLCSFYRTEAARPVVQEIVERPRVPPPLYEVVNQMNPRIIKFDKYSYLTGSDRFFINVNSDLDLNAAAEIERKLSAEK